MVLLFSVLFFFFFFFFFTFLSCCRTSFSFWCEKRTRKVSRIGFEEKERVWTLIRGALSLFFFFLFFFFFFLLVRNDQGQTPLYWACESDDPSLAQVLLDNGADVNAAESFGFSPLHLAAYLGHENLTRTLINAGAAVTLTNNEGSTPLHLAAKQNHVGVAQVLVASGKVDLLAKDLEGFTPIQLCEKGSECFDLLRDRLLEMKRARDTSGAVPSVTVPSISTTAAASNNSGGGFGSASVSPRPNEQMEKMSKAIALLTSNIDSERVRVSQLEQQLAEEQLRSQELLKKGGLSLCVKCQTRMRDRVFLPCMHFYFCGECSKGMTSCSCTTQISGKVPAKLE